MAACATLIVLAVVVVADGSIPSNDGPQHEFRSVTSMRLAAGDVEATRLWKEVVTLSSHGPGELLGVLLGWLPPERAENALLALLA